MRKWEITIVDYITIKAETEEEAIKLAQNNYEQTVIDNFAFIADELKLKEQS